MTGMPAWESSIGWGGVASRAVDGRISGYWGRGTCTHTSNTQFNQWKVNLFDMYTVDSVVLYNRQDCCTARLVGAKVKYFIDFVFSSI